MRDCGHVQMTPRAQCDDEAHRDELTVDQHDDACCSLPHAFPTPPSRNLENRRSDDFRVDESGAGPGSSPLIRR